MADGIPMVKAVVTTIVPGAPSRCGIVLKDDHRQVAWFFAVCAVILVAAGIIVPFTVADGPWLGVMSIMGSVIIVALLSAAAVPHLQQRRHSAQH